MADKLLTLTLLDARTKKSLRNSELRLFCFENAKPKRKILRPSDGKCQLKIRGTEQATYVTAVVRAPGYREWIGLGHQQGEAFEVKAGEPKDVTIELQPGPSVRGRVVNEEGKAIAGAEIQLTLAGPNWCSWPHSFGWNDFHEPPSLKTDRHGYFEMLHLYADEAHEQQGRYVLTFRHPRYVMTHVQAVELLPTRDWWIDLKVTMPRGVGASGVARLPSGKPLPGGEITFQVRDPRADEPACIPSEKTSSVGSTGRFNLKGIGPRVYNVQIEGEHCAPFQQENVCVPVDGLKGLNFQVEPSVVFKGRFVDEKGKGVADQSFRVFDEAARMFREFSSDSRGRFEIRGLSADREFQLTVPPFFEQKYRPADSPVIITLGEIQKLFGTVKEAATGDPPSEPFRIGYHGLGYSTGIDANAGSKTFELTQVPPGQYELIVYGEPYVAELYKATVPLGGMKRGLPIRLKKGAALSGRVVDRKSGKPIAASSIRLRARVETILWVYDNKQATTDQNGRFKIEGLGERPYLIFISHPKYACEYVVNFEIQKGQSRKQINRPLVKGGKVSGTVVDVRGEPVAEQRIKLQISGKRCPFPLPECLTDEDGQFLLKNVPTGKVAIHAGDMQQEVHVEDRKTSKVSFVSDA